MNFFFFFIIQAAFAYFPEENYEKQLEYLKIKYLRLMKLKYEKDEEEFGKIASFFWEIKKSFFNPLGESDNKLLSKIFLKMIERSEAINAKQSFASKVKI